VPDGRRGPGAIALRANPRITTAPADTRDPETVGVTTRAVRSTVAGRRVSASIWLRGTRPGTTVVLRLVERDAAREVGAQVARVSLAGGGWRQLAVVYEPRADQSSLDLELTVTKLGDVAILVADDAAVLVRSA